MALARRYHLTTTNNETNKSNINNQKNNDQQSQRIGLVLRHHLTAIRYQTFLTNYDKKWWVNNHTFVAQSARRGWHIQTVSLFIAIYSNISLVSLLFFFFLRMCVCVSVCQCVSMCFSLPKINVIRFSCSSIFPWAIQIQISAKLEMISVPLTTTLNCTDSHRSHTLKWYVYYISIYIKPGGIMFWNHILQLPFDAAQKNLEGFPLNVSSHLEQWVWIHGILQSMRKKLKDLADCQGLFWLPKRAKTNQNNNNNNNETKKSPSKFGRRKEREREGEKSQEKRGKMRGEGSQVDWKQLNESVNFFSSAEKGVRHRDWNERVKTLSSTTSAISAPPTCSSSTTSSWLKLHSWK